MREWTNVILILLKDQGVIMKFKKAFSFMAADPSWIKKLLGVIWVIFVPVVGMFILLGYFAKITKAVIENGNDILLPELDFKADLKMGWKIFLLHLIYSVPMIVLVFLAAIFSAIFSAIDLDAVYVLIALSSVCFSILMILLGILTALVLPIAVANFIAEDDFKAGIDLKAVFRMLKNSFRSWLLVFCGNWIAQMMTMLGLPSVLGGVVFSIYAGLAYFHLIGQAYTIAGTPKTAEITL